jgi:simple sugar transport system substrate-binding protein
MRRVLVLLIAIALIAGACGDDDAEETTTSAGAEETTTTGAVTQEDEEFHIVVNFIGGAEIQFFAVVEKGVEAAGDDLVGVRAEYSSPQCCDINEQAASIRAIAAGEPDGLAIEFNDPAALTEPTLEAMDQGIAVILTNVQVFDPTQTDPRIQALAYVGQNEFESGGKVAALLEPHLPDWTEKIVCVNPGPGQIVQTIRCDGVAAYFEPLGIQVDTLVNENTVPAEGIGVVGAYMSGNENVGGIVTLNPETMSFACSWIEQNDASEVALGGYDLGPATIECIDKGITKFSVVQQAFAQGYLSVVNLFMHLKYGMTPVDMNTGTASVNADNVDDFRGLVEAGIGG